MVDITPGDSGANKGFWRKQLRDRFGKFVEMGGMVMFDVRLPGVDGIVQGIGKFIGNAEPGLARIEVLDNSRVPKGVYLVKPEDITAIEAVLPDAYVEEKLEEVSDKASSKPELLDRVSGDEALKTRMKSVAKALKDEGRFPIPRQGALTEIGKTSDISKGARLDYQKVFDAEPALQERFKTFENMWNYVYTNGTDLTTQSPNDLAEIPEDMRLLNRAYAKHVLNLDPDGFLTVYRNAVNGKDTESESAVGYVSLDRQMAWDYNSTRENIGANGRYEIDVKPDEVYGLLGYSRIEDEYGLTIGRGVTEQEGRVRRVGDLEPAKLAPWLEEWNNSFKRQQGSSPLRGFGVAGEYDFHEVEDFGENIQEFFAKYNIQASDVAAKFDQLYGEGSYARYKESGNTVSFQLIKKMFVKLDNGNLGLNAEYLDSFATLKPNAEYKDDQFDNVMKMLSVFQELTGKPFMTHKTRDYTPPDTSGDASTMYDEFFDGGMVDLRALRNSGDRVSPYDLEMFSEDQLAALGEYGQAGHRWVNKVLRGGDPISDKEQKIIDGLDSAIEENGEVFSAARIFRGDTPNQSSDYYKFLEGLTEGKVINFPGYFSASNDAQIAFSEFGPGQGGSDDDASNSHLGSTFFWSIDIPENGKAMAMPEGLGYGQGAESEVILPRNTQLKIIGIKKVEQLDDEGNPTGNYNYFIHAGQQVDATAPEPEPSGASNDNARLIAEDLEAQPLVRFLERVGPQLGSNEGGTFKDSIFTGKDYYVKTPKSETHRRNEMLASSLYRLSNVGSAGVRFGSDADGVEKTYSEIIQGKLLADTPLTPEIKKQIQENFAIDAWLSNWDVAGLGDDNIVIGTDGKPYRIDMGGALLFRAQGAPKGEAFGDEVTEIDTLRDSDRNSATAALFGDMTYSDLVASASKLLDISPGEIDILVDATFDEPLATELKAKLKARRNNILSRFNLLDGGEPADSPSTTEEAPDYSAIDYEAADFNDVTVLQIENSDQKTALDYYTGEGDLINEFGHAMMNSYLRTKTWYKDTDAAQEQAILKKIEDLRGLLNSSIIDKDIKVIRYQDYTLDGATAVGDIWTSDGFLSTATATINGDEVYNAFTGKSVEVEISIPKGSRGGAVPGSIEAEVLLPPGSKFIVQSIERINFKQTKIKLLLVGQDD